MKIWLLRAGTVLALAILVLSFTNASWLADSPKGKVKLLAMGGLGQYPVRAKGCAAGAIEQPVHDYLENTVASAQRARGMTAAMIEIGVAPTADGRIAVFGDADLACRTDGKGPVRGKTLAELQQLDIAYGYTADGGKSFPLRGTGIGRMPALEDVLTALPEKPLLFRFNSPAAGDAALLAKALKAAGRDSGTIGDGFYGNAAQIAAIKAQFPKAWGWDPQAAAQCSGDYTLYGWTGIVPESCKNGTMVIPLDGQWKFWGFPDRLIARLEAAGTKIVLTGPASDDGIERGLSLPEQIPDVPTSFNGYLLVEDMWTVAAALRPASDKRSEREVELAEAGLERRRAKQ